MDAVREDQHEHDYDDAHDGVMCPRCMGMASINCHCGGDLCVCENYGEMDCPYCHGEGAVSPQDYDAYLDRQREIAKLWKEAFDKESTPNDPDL